ncbi:MAG: Crp/Fnr family transcriptional regulator [Flavobacteriaceae bacterium]|jgi:CRP-like cAMP-binding protein|nr:Crp/Fnr family transcriptional regulator [Flavobacteriaceae bacterium]
MEKYITTVPFYDLLTEEEKVFLEKNCSIVDFDDREAIFKQGSFAVNTYIILEGYCKLTYQCGDKKKIIFILRQGEIIGRDYLLFEHYPYSAHTLTPSRLMVIPKTFLKSICEANSQFHIKLTNRLENKMIDAMRWMIDLSFKNVEGAVAMFILKFCTTDFEGIDLSRTEIAEVVGYSRESIIHTLTKFEKENLIKNKGKNITIKDLEKLENITKYG